MIFGASHALLADVDDALLLVCQEFSLNKRHRRRHFRLGEARGDIGGCRAWVMVEPAGRGALKVTIQLYMDSGLGLGLFFGSRDLKRFPKGRQAVMTGAGDFDANFVVCGTDPTQVLTVLSAPVRQLALKLDETGQVYVSDALVSWEAEVTAISGEVLNQTIRAMSEMLDGIHHALHLER